MRLRKVLNFVPMSANNVSHETGQNIKPVVGIRRLKEPMVATLKTRIFTASALPLITWIGSFS